MALRKPRPERDRLEGRQIGCAADGTYETDKGMYRAHRLTQFAHRAVKKKNPPRVAKSHFFVTKTKRDKATGEPFYETQKIIVPEEFRFQASDVSIKTRGYILNQGEFKIIFISSSPRKKSSEFLTAP